MSFKLREPMGLVGGPRGGRLPRRAFWFVFPLPAIALCEAALLPAWPGFTYSTAGQSPLPRSPAQLTTALLGRGHRHAAVETNWDHWYVLPLVASKGYRVAPRRANWMDFGMHMTPEWIRWHVGPPGCARLGFGGALRLCPRARS
eukprot:scaffold447_cov307-Pinguiococcus_pyrenoidosus.AAC.35